MIDNLIKIADECSHFIKECHNYPLIKKLKCNGEFVRKIKVRKKSRKDGFIQNFNSAFDDMYNNLHGRSIFCNDVHMDNSEDEGMERFYVFPINGFKFLFNPSVDYHREYQELYEKMSKLMTHEECEKVFVDIIQYSYKESNVPLHEALLSEKEIIIFGIPYYYAVKVNKFPTYSLLLHEIKDLDT